MCRHFFKKLHCVGKLPLAEFLLCHIERAKADKTAYLIVTAAEGHTYVTTYPEIPRGIGTLDVRHRVHFFIVELIALLGKQKACRNTEPRRKVHYR